MLAVEKRATVVFVHAGLIQAPADVSPETLSGAELRARTVESKSAHLSMVKSLLSRNRELGLHSSRFFAVLE